MFMAMIVSAVVGFGAMVVGAYELGQYQKHNSIEYKYSEWRIE